MEKRVAIVILNWNGEALMRQFLPSVVRYSPAEIAEVVVADNGSTDGSVEMLREAFPSVRLILLDKNYGFAEGYNRALEAITTPYVVLLNSDVEVTEGWLNAPLRALDEDEDTVAVQPKIRSQRQPSYFEYAGAAGGFMDQYGYPFCRGRIFDVVEEDRGQYDQAMDVLWASGACLFIRTDIYKEAGGLDAGFFAHQEEIDLCWRLRSRGYRIRCTPESVVKTFLNFRNNLLMLYKNLPADKLRHVMRIRLFLDYLAALKFLLVGHPANARAVYEARRAFRALLPEYASKRRENMEKMLLRSVPELRDSSLLVRFYLKGEKTFAELK